MMILVSSKYLPFIGIYAFAIGLDRFSHLVQVFYIYCSCKAQQSLAGYPFYFGLC